MAEMYRNHRKSAGRFLARKAGSRSARKRCSGIVGGNASCSKQVAHQRQPARAPGSGAGPAESHRRVLRIGRLEKAYPGHHRKARSAV